MSKIEVNAVEPQCGTTLTLGASGDTVDLSNASVTLPSGIQAVSWQTGSIKTSGFTAAAGEGYFCNTSSSAFTVTLPSGSAGAVVAVSDYTRTFQTNNLTISPQSGEKIGGIAADATLSTEGQTATFVYVDSTEGWINVQETSNSITGRSFIAATGGTVTTCGNFKVHTFTGPGTFCVSTIANQPADNQLDYLVVAGGGGGGGSAPCFTAGGGGGGGGFRLSNDTCMPAPLTSPLANSTGITATVSAFPITVGGGGSGYTGYGNVPPGAVGANSVFSTITSAGGGGGKTYTGDCSANPNANGGSGGGGGAFTGAPQRVGGNGNTPPTSPPQGNPGGDSPTSSQDSNVSGAGGGGAGATGSNSSSGNGGAGGVGSFVVSAGFAGCNGTTGPVSSTRYFSGGGGGGASTGASGGSGGGGAGANMGPSANGTAGTTNTGGGGGGTAAGPTPHGSNTGGNGGSGIVIIRYKYQ